MLGTAIKNTILFLLIILILHFLIINVLVEKKLLNTKKIMKTENKEDQIESINKLIDNPKPENYTTVKVDKMKELYDYVFDEDATNDLDKYYNVDTNIEKNNKEDVQVKCAEELGGNKNLHDY